MENQSCGPLHRVGVKPGHETLDVQFKILEMLCPDVWAVGSLSVTFVRLFEGCRFTFGLKYAWVVWTRTVRFWSPGI